MASFLNTYPKERALDRIELYDEPDPAPALEGCVYSTNPAVATASNGKRYFLKGPDPLIVAAEVLAYRLAGLVELSVPSCALCIHPRTGETLFASEASRFSSGIDSLIQPPHPINPELMPHVVVFDTWIGNWDRNIGSIVAEPVRQRDSTQVRLLAIDFEKAEVLRGRSIFEVTVMEPARWWPQGDLASLCNSILRPLAFVTRICAITRANVDELCLDVARDLGREISRAQEIAHQLAWRAEHIDRLSSEVWNA